MREQAGLKQSEIASKVNVRQSAVSMWETGNSFPSRTTLLKLAELYNCTADVLLKGGELSESKYTA